MTKQRNFVSHNKLSFWSYTNFPTFQVDLLVAITSKAEHQAQLQTLLKQLSQHSLIVKAMCQFGQTTIDFLGLCISKDGAILLPSMVDAVATFPRPLTVKSLQEYLGMVNLYRHFIPSAAQLTWPLFETLT